jgi:hypothetical protein
MDLLDVGDLSGKGASCAKLGNGAENMAAAEVRKWRLFN